MFLDVFSSKPMGRPPRKPTLRFKDTCYTHHTPHRLKHTSLEEDRVGSSVSSRPPNRFSPAFADRAEARIQGSSRRASRCPFPSPRRSSARVASRRVCVARKPTRAERDAQRSEPRGAVRVALLEMEIKRVTGGLQAYFISFGESFW